MTPEQRAKAFSESKKVLDWTAGDPIAEAWLDGYGAKAESYIESAVFQGMERTINDLLYVIKALQEEKQALQVVEWVRASDKSPERNGDYLVKMNQGILRGPKTRKYSQNKWHYTKSEQFQEQHITYWAELPEGPK